MSSPAAPIDKHCKICGTYMYSVYSDSDEIEKDIYCDNHKKEPKPDTTIKTPEFVMTTESFEPTKLKSELTTDLSHSGIVKSFPVKLIPVSDNFKDIMPIRATSESACFDICADIRGRTIAFHSQNNYKHNYQISNDPEKYIIEPKARALIPTGFIFVIPHGYSMRLHPRSGHGWKHGVCLMNGEGVIDSDYPNETFVMLYNASNLPFIVKHGERIAQTELVKTIYTSFELLSKDAKFENETDRVGGFGST